MLLFFDGFEYASADIPLKWDSGNSTNTSYARTGTRNGYGAWTKTVSPGDANVIFGCAYYSIQAGQVGALRVLYNGSAQLAVTIRADGSIDVRQEYSGGTLIGSTAAGVWPTSGWNYLEVKILLHQTAGTVVVKVNGGTVISEIAGDKDTCYRADTLWNQIEVSSGGGSTGIDDLYLCDGTGSVNNNFLGQVRAVPLFPQTDAVDAGSNADFTCSGGTDHGALVDDDPSDGDTSYVYSSTVDHVDTWSYPALGLTGTIKGVQLGLIAKKTDSETRAIRAVARPASTNRVDATDQYLSTSYARKSVIWETNPEDSEAWEVADIDGAEFGVKVSI